MARKASDGESSGSGETGGRDQNGARAAPDPSRRALALGVVAGGCAFAAAALAPAGRFVLAPAFGAAGKGSWVRTVRRSALREGEPTRVAIVADRRDAWTLEHDVQLGSVWLSKKGDVVSAFSAVCPHLGCSVDAVPGGFSCPCHTSAFAPDGARRSGPSPRALDALATRIEDDFVVVEFKRFRIGVAEKVET